MNMRRTRRHMVYGTGRGSTRLGAELKQKVHMVGTYCELGKRTRRKAARHTHGVDPKLGRSAWRGTAHKASRPEAIHGGDDAGRLLGQLADLFARW